MTERSRGALSDIRVLDLSRILAGPTCTQLLGDLGADIIKVERHDTGDDTRSWGPPFIDNDDESEARRSAYFACANRNKRSLALDIASSQGQAIVRKLLANCDILIENFKTGGLAKYDLDYSTLVDEFPQLIYCSITGFGQTGPYAGRPGYDFLIQAMGGIMSLTGEPEGSPVKVGVGIADVMCGMYASSAILAALHHRTQTGKGQHIDLALMDAQIAWLINEATNYLTSGEVPARRGNAHPNIVPYQVFEACDGHFVLAVGNDGQFARFCQFAGLEQLIDDPRFATNPARLENRHTLTTLIGEVTRTKSQTHWIEGLEAVNVPCGPVNRLDQVFDDPQVRHRGMRLEMADPATRSGEVSLLANPLNLSGTPVDYRYPPPRLGEHSREILTGLAGYDAAVIAELVAKDVIKCA